MTFPSGLPIDAISDAVCVEVGKTPYLVVSASTGSGKSTILPLALHVAYPTKRIIMLEPRRIAARAVAVRMAQILGEPVGLRVGFRTRFETLVSERTRVEVVTEGILTRILQDNPSLDGYDIVIFDEYHERTLHGDLALTLTLESISMFRPDLTLLIMSATMDTELISGFFDRDAKSFSASGRLFDVEVHYRPPKIPYMQRHSETDFLRHISCVVDEAFEKNEGDILVFLPGEAEIHQLTAMLRTSSISFGCEIMELYGNLPVQKQDEVFHRNPDDKRRIIVATPVAETSITIPQIQVVIDSGLVRRPFFSPANGLDKLRTVHISKASAEQRRGRAGRTASGVCYRVWSMQDQNNMEAYTPPEITQTDLTETILELATWGIPRNDIERLHWMTFPPEANLSYAYELLDELGAISADGLATDYGKKLQRLPLHPRIAHACMFAVEQFGTMDTAIRLAALLGEKDVLMGCGSADLNMRLNVLNHRDNTTNRETLKRVKMTQKQLESTLLEEKKRLNNMGQGNDSFSSVILAAAFPDRIARRRERDSYDYVMSNGTVARLRNNDPLQLSEYLVIADLGGTMNPPTIFSALALNMEDIRKYLPYLFHEEHLLAWDGDACMVRASDSIRIGSLVISRKQGKVKDDDDPSDILIHIIRKNGLEILHFSKRTIALLNRMRFLARCGFEQFEVYSTERLLLDLENWLAPLLGGVNKLEQLEQLSYFNIFDSMLLPQDRILLQKEAPEFFFAPSGSRLKIDYSGIGQPIVHVKLQELFGLDHGPKLAGGRSCLAFDLLSPAMRTVQITSDIDAFWDGSYALVRKDMKSRYPKHNWPDNPRMESPSRSSIKRRP